MLGEKFQYFLLNHSLMILNSCTTSKYHTWYLSCSRLISNFIVKWIYCHKTFFSFTIRTPDSPVTCVTPVYSIEMHLHNIWNKYGSTLVTVIYYIFMNTCRVIYYKTSLIWFTMITRNFFSSNGCFQKCVLDSVNLQQNHKSQVNF